MDPDEVLAQLRRVAARVTTEYFQQATTTPVEDDALELAEVGRALDGWLSKGGFLPRAWEARR
jgi:hypothetical protein